MQRVQSGPEMMHVLLVEDHSMLRRLLEHVLTDAGMTVTLAGNADQAIALIGSGLAPDLLLSDIRMPGEMNGLELARWVRDHHPGVAILLQTGIAEALGGDFRVLQKPFSPDMLLSAVADALRGRGELVRLHA